MGKKLEPWEECPDVWPTKASYFNWLRGQLRGGAWNRHPVKLKFINENRFKAPIGRLIKKTGKHQKIWAGKCSCCGEILPTKKLQVDHKSAAGSFKGWHDLEEWVHDLVHVNCSMLQFMCKPCHEIKSYAEMHGMSFEDATIEKQVIAWLKDTSVEVQKAVLASWGLPNNNEKVRRNSYRELLIQEKDDEDTTTTNA